MEAKGKKDKIQKFQDRNQRERERGKHTQNTENRVDERGRLDESSASV